MKALTQLMAIICCILIIAAPRIAFAGLEPTPGTVPEPTALLVWAGLAGIGGLFFYRRHRDAE